MLEAAQELSKQAEALQAEMEKFLPDNEAGLGCPKFRLVRTFGRTGPLRRLQE